MEDLDVLATGGLMLVAGHETTVNLIANGTLTMLRHPHLIERLRDEPEISLKFVEELLRFEPPVQYLPNRVAATEIEVNGTTIPKGSRIVLLTAAASRDPELFDHPDEFDPDRPKNLHYGFGGGIHYCFGAPAGPPRGPAGADGDRPRLHEPAPRGRSAAVPPEPGPPRPDPPRGRRRRRRHLTPPSRF
jgi:cytochrome P450